MLCSEVRSHISAYVDGELASDMLQDLQRHIDACKACRYEVEIMHSLDRQLEKGLSLGATRGQAVERIEMLCQQASKPTQTESTDWTAWVVGLLTLAACIVLVYRESLRPPGEFPKAGEMPVATLVRATGSVHLQLPESDQWNPLSDATSVSIAKGSRIRTQADIRCELQTPDNSTIRVDEKSELVMHDSRRCEVVRGQVWCSVGNSESLRVEVPVEGEAGTVLAMECPRDSTFQWSVDDNATVCTSEADTSVTLSCGPFQCPVDPGATVAIDRQVHPRQVDNPIGQSKAWQLPLLAMNRTDSADQWHDELFSTVRPLLAPIGFTKVTHLNERQILALGPAGAIPLLAYVEDPRSKADPQLRQTAMRLACEIAGANAVNSITALTHDEDPAVADFAARTLASLGR